MRVGEVVGGRFAVLRVCIRRPLVFSMSSAVAWFAYLHTRRRLSPATLTHKLHSEPPLPLTVHFLHILYFCRFHVSFGSSATTHYRQPSMTAANSKNKNNSSNCNRLQCFVDLVFTALLHSFVFVFCRPAITCPMVKAWAAFVCVHVQWLSKNSWSMEKIILMNFLNKLLISKSIIILPLNHMY